MADSDGGTSNLSIAREWFQNPLFNRYWRHYNQAQAWIKKWASPHSCCSNTAYENWCRAMSQYHHNCATWMSFCGSQFMQMAQSLQQPMASPSPNVFKIPAVPPHRREPTPAHASATDSESNSESASGSKSAKKKRRKKRRNFKREEAKKAKKSQMKRRQHLLFSDLEDIPSDLEFVLDLSGELEETDGVEYHMEISEDMLEFFAQSAKHKQEREVSKQALVKEEADKEEYTDLTSISAHKSQVATTAPPREQPGALRSSEMQQLYGQGAAMIHAMETAMQLSFHRNCDRKQPQLWPQLPLNILFHE